MAQLTDRHGGRRFAGEWRQLARLRNLRLPSLFRVSHLSAAAISDPYAPRPTFLQRNANAMAASVVFVATATLAVLSFPPFKAPEFAYAMLVPGIFWA